MEKIFEIVPEKCVGCGACADDCPVRAIDKVKNFGIIYQEICTHCGSCYEICPVGAVIFHDKKLSV